METRLKPTVDESHSRVPEIVAVSRDIAQRRLSEAARAAASRKYESLVRALNEVVYERLLPEELILWSDTVENVFGYTCAEIGNSQQGWLDRIHPEDKEQVSFELDRAINEGRTFSFKYRFLNKEADYLWIHDRGVIHLSSNGTPRTIIGIMANITEKVWMEEELNENQERFKSTFSDAAIGMAILSTDGIFLEVNKAACKLLGYNEAALPNLDLWQVMFKDDVSASRQVFSALVKGKTDSSESDRRFVCKDGSVIWAHVSTSVVGRWRTKPSYLICQIQDITKRKQDEESLRKSEGLLRNALNAACDGAWDFNLLDKKLRCNERVERLLGYASGSLACVNGFWDDYIHPDDRPRIVQLLEKYRSTHTFRLSAKFRLRKSSGQWQEVFLRGRATQLDEKGRLLSIAGTLVALTEGAQQGTPPPFLFPKMDC